MGAWHVVLLSEKRRAKGFPRRRRLVGYTYTATSDDGSYLAGRHVHRTQESALEAAQRRIDHRGGTIAGIRIGGSGRLDIPGQKDIEE